MRLAAVLAVFVSACTTEVHNYYPADTRSVDAQPDQDSSLPPDVRPPDIKPQPDIWQPDIKPQPDIWQPDIKPQPDIGQPPDVWQPDVPLSDDDGSLPDTAVPPDVGPQPDLNVCQMGYVKCDDGDLCTFNDTCVGDKCVGTPYTCPALRDYNIPGYPMCAVNSCTGEMLTKNGQLVGGCTPTEISLNYCVIKDKLTGNDECIMANQFFDDSCMTCLPTISQTSLSLRPGAEPTATIPCTPGYPDPCHNIINGYMWCISKTHNNNNFVCSCGCDIDRAFIQGNFCSTYAPADWTCQVRIPGEMDSWVCQPPK